MTFVTKEIQDSDKKLNGVVSSKWLFF